MAKKQVVVPQGFISRQYQKELYNCRSRGLKRGIAVWHRRAGKDKVFMAMLAAAAIQEVGIYFYILPYYKQARKVIWEGMDAKGVRNLAVFPDEVIQHSNNQEMVLTLVNGSIIYFLGSDNVDSIIGTNPIGVFFSEYSLHKPGVWDFLRPILIENGGFAFFNGTPRGRNHMYHMLKAAQKKPDEWFSQVLTIEDTGVMTAEEVEKEIQEGMDPAIAKQEFYCSFDAALKGAYYEEAMSAMLVDGRLRQLPYDPYVPVDVSWDLGIADTQVLLFIQVVGVETRFIDLVYNTGKGLDFYVREIQKRPYVYGTHYLPHDAKARELGNYGKTRIDSLIELGLKNLVVVKKHAIADGINETRRLLTKVYIDTMKCDMMIEALRAYRKEWNEDTQSYSDHPKHDWASHFADAVRTYAMGYRALVDASKLVPIAIGTDHDPLNKNVDLQPYVTSGTKKLNDPAYEQMLKENWILMDKRNWNPLAHLSADM
jgi:hypothetical protein